jgi:hypothetical protein
VAERRVYDFSRGKYGVIEGTREGLPAMPEPRNVEALTALVLGAFATGLVSAYLLGLLLVR